ncbi:MAG: hypothetical protein ACXAC5_03895 [Promethearchaeota archaeon]|jgi:hypothetical protein
MGFVAALIILTVCAVLGNEIYQRHRETKRRERALEESAKREKQRRMQSWSGGKDFWE